MAVVMTVDELERFLAAEFPQIYHPDSGLAVDAVWEGGCRVRQTFRASSIRAGGTISGPTMMGLADFALFVAGLGAIGSPPPAASPHRHHKFFCQTPPRPATRQGARPPPPQPRS